MAHSALLSPPVDERNSRTQLEVLAPLGLGGLSDCPECIKSFMGASTKGPSSAQLQNIRYHMAEIYGDADAANDSSGAGSIKNN